MKIRHGFVSNSSSSSFVIRGTLVPLKNLEKIYGEMDSQCTVSSIEEKIGEKLNGLMIQPFINYFSRCDGEGFDSVIIGEEENISWEDGDIVSIDSFGDVDKDKDDKLRLKLANIVDTSLEDIKIGTYMQFVSNDNY